MLDAPTTNAQWLHAAKDFSNDETWMRLSDTYRTAILKHCTQSGLTPQESDDVAQEALAHLALVIQRTGPAWEPQSLRPFLTDVVNRFIIDHHKNAPHRHLPPNVATLVQQWMEPQEDDPVTRSNQIESETHLLTLALNRARSQVSAQHWQIFDSYAIQGMSSRETAKIFNTSHFNVRLIAHRIKKLVRRHYDGLLTQDIELTP